MSEEPFRKTEGEASGIRVRKNLLNIGIFAAEILLLVFAGPRAVRFFLPAIVGWLIAQLANPLVKFLERHLHIVRRHSSFGIIFGAIFLIVMACYYALSVLFYELRQLIGSLPVYYDAMMAGLGRIGENLQGVLGKLQPEVRERIAEMMEQITSNLGQMVSSLGGITMETAGRMAKNIPSILISFVFTILFAYFFIAQRERIYRIARKVVPGKIRQEMHVVRDNIRHAVGGYLRAQFKIMGVIIVLLFAGFVIMGIDYALLLAILIGFLDFLPMLGTGTALLPWALYFALSDAIPRAAGMLILYGVTQATHQLIQPKMVGDSIGVDSLTTLALLFVGYRISGFLGMIIAIPVGMILIQFYEAGAFNHIIRNVKELLETIREWRGLEKEE